MSDMTILYPGQCCSGYCVGDLVHNQPFNQAERIRAVLVDRQSEVDRLTADNARLRDHLSAYSDGRPVLRQAEGPTP